MLQQNVFSIFQGDDKVMSLKAIYAENGDPLDLTSCTEIDVALPNADGTFAHRLLSTGQVAITSPALLGKITCPISAAVSALMNLGELQNLDVVFTIASKKTTVRFASALSVFQR